MGRDMGKRELTPAAQAALGAAGGETYTIHDPFLNKPAEVSNRLVDRLRGKYAVGPILPNGEPEFGWRQMPAPPIQQEAADVIERLQKRVELLETYQQIPLKTEGMNE